MRQTLGSARFVYNYCLDYAETLQENGEKYPGYYGFSAKIAELKQNPEYEWLKSADSTALQNAAKAADRAYLNMFARRADKPRFKSKHDSRQTYTSTNNKTKSGDTIRFVDDKHIRVPKVGNICFRGSKRNYISIGLGTLKLSPAGKWYISLSVEVNLDKHKHGNATTSIDLGIKSYATTFNGENYEHIENPKVYESRLAKLRREERKLARMRNHETKAMKAYGIHSRNYEKQRRKVARLYEQITNIRMDFLHKLSRQLAVENQALIVETLEVKRMMENNDITRINRLIADASWGTFIRILEYKCGETGCQLYKIEKDFPSTEMCSYCGNINRNITLSMRRITCPECRETYDRDENAARNLYKRWLNAVDSSA